MVFQRIYIYSVYTKGKSSGKTFLGLEDVVRGYELCKKKEEVSDSFMDELLGYEEAYEKKNGGSDAAGIGRTVVCAGEEI